MCAPLSWCRHRSPFPQVTDRLTLPRSWALASISVGAVGSLGGGDAEGEVGHMEEASLWPEGGRWCLVSLKMCLIHPGPYLVETCPWCSWWL